MMDAHLSPQSECFDSAFDRNSDATQESGDGSADVESFASVGSDSCPSLIGEARFDQNSYLHPMDNVVFPRPGAADGVAFDRNSHLHRPRPIFPTAHECLPHTEEFTRSARQDVQDGSDDSAHVRPGLCVNRIMEVGRAARRVLPARCDDSTVSPMWPVLPVMPVRRASRSSSHNIYADVLDDVIFSWAAERETKWDADVLDGVIFSWAAERETKEMPNCRPLRERVLKALRPRNWKPVIGLPLRRGFCRAARVSSNEP
mmetsp:Transcript_45814/g.118512  ORF Transcript_45814/g.118512 Transcript_45814/m.118512 type:complete len:259 (-) Transcript_45814:56-832(-)